MQQINEASITAVTTAPKSWRHAQLVNSLAAGNSAQQILISPDGQTLAGVMNHPNDKTIKVWNLTTGQEMHTLEGYPRSQLAFSIESMAFSPDGKLLASSSYFTYQKTLTIQLWDVKTGKLVRTFKRTVEPKVISQGPDGSVNYGQGSTIVFSPDGKTLATVAGGHRTIQLWDINKGVIRQTMTGVEGLALKFSPKGQLMAMGNSKEIKLWNVKTGQLVRTLRTHNRPLINFSFSPDEKSLYSWAAMAPDNPEGVIQTWDLSTGKLLRTFGAIHWDASVIFSPDGQTYATTGNSQAVIKLYDLKTGKEIQTLPPPTPHIPSPVTFSPNGQLLAAVTGETISIWR